MGLPTRVDLVDVTPRDGLQDARGELTTEQKVALIQGIAAAGIRRIEALAFVSPRWVPRMRDAEQAACQLAGLAGPSGIIALVPNLIGFERALESGISEVTYVVSASPTHQRANLRMSLEESFIQLQAIMNRARANTVQALDADQMRDAAQAREQDPASGPTGPTRPTQVRGPVRVRGAISCAFGTPYEDESFLPRTVAEIAGRLAQAGVDEIGLADTVGLATPSVIAQVIDTVRAEVGAGSASGSAPAQQIPLALHLHDRQGMGLDNLRMALSKGVTTIEAALGGLGGCPFAPNAPGNLDLEQVVELCDLLGIHTGVDAGALAQVRKTLLRQLNNQIE